MSKPKILVIEDERALVEVLSYNLEREGFEVLVAYDGQDGLRQAQIKLPDLVVLDLMLPLKAGLEVCRELRLGTRTREIPIIMVTAKAAEEVRPARSGSLPPGRFDRLRDQALLDQGPGPADQEGAEASPAPGRADVDERLREPGRRDRPPPAPGVVQQRRADADA